MEETKLTTQTNTTHETDKTAKPVVKRAAPSRAPTHIKVLNEDIPKPLTFHEQKLQRAEEARVRLRREWEVESQKVTGVFRDLEVGAGGNLRFSARKYQWDQTENFDFFDGHTYTIPLWVAKHLNEGCKFPVYRHNIDPNASPGEKVQQMVGQWNHRFAFVSSDFMGIYKPKSPDIIVVGNQ